MAHNNFKFTAEEKQQIRKAVEAAELKTSGEIVPFFTDQSDEYEIATLRGAIIFVITALFIAGLLSYTWTLPFPITPLEIIIFTLAMGGLGFVLTRYIAPVKRLFIPNELMLERVEQKALVAFLEEEVFNTEKRTGILIYISHFEHLVEVIGDSGINAKVENEEWQAVVKAIIEGIKAKDPARGIIKGISLCGELLERAGVNKPPENRNELSDDIRLS